jgi:hypothetical protein
MYYLAEVFPFLKRFSKLPLTRDQLILIIAAINELFMGLDTYLAHGLNGTIRWNEWIPILFGTIAGILLILAGLLASKQRLTANLIASIVFVASIIVGFLGAYFHVARGAILPYGPLDERLNIAFLIWAPPAIAPLAFVLVGVLGISAAWIETPTGSGRLQLTQKRSLQMPFSKTRAYFMMVSFGIVVTLVSSTLDHARTGFLNAWLWLPLVVPLVAALVAFLIGLKNKPDLSDLSTYTFLMLLMASVGGIGFILHVLSDLTPSGQFVFERFLRGAPFLAPLLYANMAAMGLIVLLDPHEKIKS